MVTMATTVDTAVLRAGIMTGPHRLDITATILHQRHHEAAILIARPMPMIDLPYHMVEVVDMTDTPTDLIPIEEAMDPVQDRVAMGAVVAAVDIVATILTMQVEATDPVEATAAAAATEGRRDTGVGRDLLPEEAPDINCHKFGHCAFQAEDIRSCGVCMTLQRRRGKK